MKKLIYAIVVVCVVNAGEMQEMYCGDKSLSYCINHFKKQCDAKNYGACGVVGWLQYEQKQYGEAKKYYEMVCDKANSKDSYQVERIDGSLGPKVPAIEVIKATCAELGRFYYNGLGVRQDYSKALQYRKKACDLDNAGACSGAGFLYYVGEGTKKDYKLAKKYFEKACKMQYGGGCNLLAAMYMSGEGVPANFSKAKELFGKACDFGEQAGCDAYKNLNKLGVE